MAQGGSKSKPLPPIERLVEFFDYSIVTGQLFWAKDYTTSGGYKTYKKGTVTSVPRPGKPLLVCFDNFSWKAHRLIWKIVTGEDPGEDEIDHRNGDQHLNAWVNIRIVTRCEQNANRRRPKNNTSGVKGVGKTKDGQWRVAIKFEKQSYYLGNYDSFEEAVAVRLSAEAVIHGEHSAGGRGNEERHRALSLLRPEEVQR